MSNDETQSEASAKSKCAWCHRYFIPKKDFMKWAGLDAAQWNVLRFFYSLFMKYG